MRLESARALKAELLDASRTWTLAHPTRLERGLPRGSPPFGFDVPTVGLIVEDPTPIAVGVAPRQGKDVKLAIRVRERSAAAQALIESVRRRAAGEVDVRTTGRIAVKASRPRLWQRRRHRPLQPGTSIGHFAVTCGSLGAFVLDARDRLCVLSNNHVIANEDNAAVNDAILQPGVDDGGAGEDRVASLLRWPRLSTRGTNRVDAALGLLDREQAILGNHWYGLGALHGALSVDDLLRDARAPVAKLGRTTGLTRGRVTAVELDQVYVEYDRGDLRFDDQIEIEGSGDRAFSDGGDSGSLVLGRGGLAVGLLFAGSETGGRNDRGLTFVNPIESVLSKLGARFDL